MTGPAPTHNSRSWLATPLASVVLLAILIADAASLSHDTVVGELVHHHILPHDDSCETLYPITAYVEQSGAAIELRPFDDPVSNAYRNAQPEGDRVVAVMTADPNTTPHGFWAVTGEVFDHTIKVTSRGQPLDGATLALAREKYIVLAQRDTLTPEHAELMRQGDGVTTKIRWLGWAHNVAAIGVALALLASLRWVVRR